MIILFGLGNPQKKYKNTRHNIGINFIDYIARKIGLKFKSNLNFYYSEFKINKQKIILAKSKTFMNNSGTAVIEVKNFYKVTPDQIYVVFDDLDIQEGKYKIQFAKYPKTHNGVGDVINKLKTDKINFIRIGIDGRSPFEKKFISGAEYVLSETKYNFENIYEKIYFDLIKNFKTLK